MCMWLEPSSHTSQKPRCMCHPVSVSSRPSASSLEAADETREGHKGPPLRQNSESFCPLLERVGSHGWRFSNRGLSPGVSRPTVNSNRPRSAPETHLQPCRGATLRDKVY